MLRKLGFLTVVFLGSLSSINAHEKIYINMNDLDTEHDVIRIHTGHNIWVETEALHRDVKGLFTFECNLQGLQNDHNYRAEYRKSWKCPYCHNFWPIGTACQNPTCPSKYK